MDGVPDGEGGLTVRLARMLSRWNHGEVLDPLRIYSHHPKILRGVGLLKRAIEGGGALPDRIKSLAMHYTATQVECPFWVDLTEHLAREAGLEEDDVKALVDFETSDRFSELEKNVLRYAKGMTETPVEVSDELFDALADEFSPKQMVELTAAIAFENFSARFNHAFDIESQELKDGHDSE